MAGGVDPVRDREKQELAGQFGPEPQDPHAPPQQPPPLVCSVPKSANEPDSPPVTAKLDTSTLVLIDSQLGHGWLWSRSANLVRTSNFPEQLSHRYS